MERKRPRMSDEIPAKTIVIHSIDPEVSIPNCSFEIGESHNFFWFYDSVVNRHITSTFQSIW